MRVKYLTTLAIAALMTFHIVACAPEDNDQEVQSDVIVTTSDDPATVFQDTSEIFVERIREEDTIVVGVIIDEENYEKKTKGKANNYRTSVNKCLS